MRSLCFLIATLFASHSLACVIETHAQILILSKEGDSSQLIKHSDCEQKTLAAFLSFAQDAQGIVTQRTFARLFPNVTLKPARVEFHNLENRLGLQGILPTEGRLVSAQKLDGINFIGAQAQDHIDYECQSCPSTGENTLKISVRNVLGAKQKIHWVKATIGIPVEALIAIRAHQANLKSIDPAAFERRTILSSNPQELLDPSTPIHFFKLSRAVAPGEILKRASVSPVQLVRPGVTSQLTIRDAGITISGDALPLSYGVWGETIKLKNPRSSRVIMGKVVDHNKVVVEL